MKLKRVMFKNFLSYGNNNTTFDFDDSGMYLITGDNGFGKSVLLEVLTYVFYDSSLRKINKTELINWDNEKGLYVEVEFFSNNILYKIERGLKPGVFNIYEDGEKIDNLSSKSLTQNYLENHILKYSYEEFVGSSMLTTMTEIIPKLTPSQKRKFFENMFNIGIVDKLKTRFKNKYNNTNKSLTTIIASNEKLNGLIEGTEETIKEIDNLKEKMISENTKTISDNNIRDEKLKEEIIELKETLETNEEKYNKNLETFRKREKSVNLLTSRVNLKEEEKEYLETHDDCSSCKQKIDEEHKKKELKKINTYITKSTDKIKTAKLDSMREKLDRQYKSLNKLEVSIKTKERESREISSDNRSLLTDIKNADKIYNKKSYDSKLKEYKKELDKNLEKIDELKSNIVEYNYILEKLFSDDGIRKYVLSQYIDYLNNNISDILEVLELDFDVYITDDMDVMVERLGKSVNYFSISSGQQRMINFALMITIIKIRKIAFPNGFNILFLDEFIDIALSESNVGKIADMLNNMHTKLFKDDIIYIISHRLDNHSEIFDKRFEVTYEDNYSEIVEKV